MPRSESRPVVVKYNSKEDELKAKNYLLLLHGQRSCKH
jgi:hypothetical protein